MPMVPVDVDGLEVIFPFEPYEIQKDLMTKLIQCLRQRLNGLLESPTGTGKTLSLLCASLAWQTKQRSHFQEMMRSNLRGDSGNGSTFDVDRVSKIIYASRTHSQLSQAIGELKRCYYKKVKAVVLGSREHLCIHEEISRLTSSSAKIMGCHSRVQARSCVYHNNLNRRKEGVPVMEQTIADIEDLVIKGRQAKLCPFFMSRELVKDADIIFMPYNYILDPKLRATHGIDLKDSVIILDEGHNIAKMCEESASFEIRNTTIALCINELTKAMVDLNETSQQLGTNALTKDLSMGSIASLKQWFLKLEEELDKVEVKPEGYLLPGTSILQIFIASGFYPTRFGRIINDLDGVSLFLSGNNFETTGCDKFAGILRVLNSGSIVTEPVRFGSSYKVFVHLEEPKQGEPSNRFKPVKKGVQAKVFSFWCFNPALGLEAVLAHGPRSILLASGTLSPMSFLTEELDIPFGVQITNPHIIGDQQLFAAVVKTGPGQIALSSSYRNRSDLTYMKSLGELIVQVFSVVPKGVLIFFPSYSVMKMCTDEWQANGIWDTMLRKKKVVLEPRGKDAFHAVMEEYYANVKTGNGASLMAVCRGKVSEGLDFTDDNGRAVIITGIPYSPAKDQQVMAKQQYLDNKKKESSASMNGRVWYQLEATRAMNQAIGRIIRHAQDYGAILLCDERCDYTDVKKNLSPWIQSRLNTFDSSEEVIRGLARFFGSEVQQERLAFGAKLKKQMVRTSVIKLPQVLEPTTEVTDLEGIYGDNSVVEVMSEGRRESTTASLSEILTKKISPKATSSQRLLSGLDSIVESPLFPYGTPSRINIITASRSFENNVNKRRKLKISTTNSTFSGEFSSKPEEVTSFTSIREFWQWVKMTLSIDNYAIVVKALKELKVDSNVESFSDKIKSLFKPEQKPCFLEGLSLVLQEQDMKLLKTLLLST